MKKDQVELVAHENVRRGANCRGGFWASNVRQSQTVLFFQG